MRNRWHRTQAAQCHTPLEECAYGSRLLGAEPSLVLHGGGNTSIKGTLPDPAGGHTEVLWIKGSGHDLATIEATGFAPLRLARLRQLLAAPSLSDPQMVNELRCALCDASAPNPSVESLLHAFLPFTAVQHSHADAIVTLTNQPDGAAAVREVFGEDVLVLPYAMPGFDLARLATQRWPLHYREGIIGMVLLNHGLFTFGDTTKQAYDRHIELVSRAEQHLLRHTTQTHATAQAAHATAGQSSQRENAIPLAAITSVTQITPVDPLRLAALRKELCDTAGFALVLQQHRDAQIANFLARDDLAAITQHGTCTPDHVIFTKRTPLLGTDVASYAAQYAAYYHRNRHRARTPLTMLDPAPRVLLDAQLGMVTVGRTVRAARIVEDIYRHTIEVLEQAEALGGFRCPSEAELFDVEYWDLEQAKLRRAGSPPPLAGQVVLMLGDTYGTAHETTVALQAAGATVITWQPKQFANTHSISAALQASIEYCGGIDHVIATPADLAACASRLRPYLALSPVEPRIVLVEQQADSRTPTPIDIAADTHTDTKVNTDTETDTNNTRVNHLCLAADENAIGHTGSTAAVARMAVAMLTDTFSHTVEAYLPIASKP